MKPAVSCELQVMNWGESATSGAWVKFWVAPEDLDAFRAVKCRSGKSAGQRFAGVLVEIGDDELPEPYQTQPEPATEKPKGGPLAKLAGMWCADPMFQHWCGRNGAERAAEWVRAECCIVSRADLDHDPMAAILFHKGIRLPFIAYCKEQGIELC